MPISKAEFEALPVAQTPITEEEFNNLPSISEEEFNNLPVEKSGGINYTDFAIGPGPYITKELLKRFYSGVEHGLGGVLKGTDSDEQNPILNMVAPITEGARGFYSGVTDPREITQEDILTDRQRAGLASLRNLLISKEKITEPVPGGFSPIMAEALRQQMLTPEQAIAATKAAAFITPVPGLGKIISKGEANVASRLAAEQKAQEVAQSLSLGEVFKPLAERANKEQAILKGNILRKEYGKRIGVVVKSQKNLGELIEAKQRELNALGLPELPRGTYSSPVERSTPESWKLHAPSKEDLYQQPMSQQIRVGGKSEGVEGQRQVLQSQLDDLLSQSRRGDEQLINLTSDARRIKSAQEGLTNPHTVISASSRTANSSVISGIESLASNAGITTATLKDENLLPIIKEYRKTHKATVFSASKKLQNIGEDAAELSDRELATEIHARSLAGPYVLQAQQTWGILDDAGRVRVLDALEDSSKTNSLKIGLGGVNEFEAYATLKKALNEIGLMAKDAGLTVKGASGVRDFALLKAYFPHKWAPEGIEELRRLLNTGKIDEIASEMVRGGKFTTLDAAKETLRKFIQRQSERRVGSQFERTLSLSRSELEKAGLPQFRVDADVLPEYFDEMARRIAEAKYWGPQNEFGIQILNELAVKYGADSRQVKAAKGFMDTALRNNSSIEAAKTIRLVNSFVLGPTTSILQMAQSLMPAARGSTAGFLRGYVKSLTRAGTEAATEAGVGLKDTERLYRRALGLNSQEVKHLISNTADTKLIEKIKNIFANGNRLLEEASSRYMDMVGIKKADLFSRKTAVNVAQETARGALKALVKNPSNKFASQFFEDYGVGLNIPEMIKRGSLNRFELNRVAQMFEKENNFWYLAGDLPQFMSNEFGKTVFQFMPSAYLQSAFVKRMVWDYGIKKGNLITPFKLFIAQELGGEIHGDVKDLYALRDPTTNTSNRPGIDHLGYRIWDNAVNQGVGFGIASNIGESLGYGKIGNLMLGPSTSLASGINRINQAGLKTISGKKDFVDFLDTSAPIVTSRVGLLKPVTELLKPKNQRSKSSLLGGKKK